MQRHQYITILLATLAFAICGVASADDGAITNKSMSKTINVPTFDQETVNEKTPEAEHAFADFMKFYVPAQAASGEVLTETDAGGIEYCNIDGQAVQDNLPNDGEKTECPLEDLVETLAVAKPLVNVFIYGPQFDVHNTAFAHRWFDTYAAVSLDDGETFKKTNLSQTADLSSFNLADHVASKQDPLPNDHTILLGNKRKGAWHAPGYETPYEAHCIECHGPALIGTTQTPSCYSCHKSVWEEETMEGVGPIIYKANYFKGKVQIFGENAEPRSTVTIVNGTTGEELWTTRTKKRDSFRLVKRVTGDPPCTVAAISNEEEGPSILVTDKKGEPVEDCEGHPVDVTDYPGGSYNVFRAVAGNKVLVAWPSRYCEQGQPAYSLTTDNEDEDNGIPADEKLDHLIAITDFIRDGSVELGVPALPDFTSTRDNVVNDLYLVDAFGVAGKQGSVNFADEGYPQAGIVPFGCVWTARGVLLPGDDPRTEDFTEESHMVWTKAERLTSGRRDPNRIEVHAVQGAGFVITWQEDPEGLRPGQGLGPGEGWSGAVAHSQTDAWYSFINEEYFDIVRQAYTEDEKVAYTLDPIDILNHDLTLSGRPQVFVPMAVPMRLSNNAKCNPPDKVTSGEGTPAIYCAYDPDAIDGVDQLGAKDFFLRDQCADTVTIWTGNINNGLVENEICVADSFDGIAGADLPNRANTSITRPRTSLQGYTNGTDKSAWVVVAAEESKGLGKYFFNPDGLLDNTFDGYADMCAEDSSPTCTEEIGKNQWYFSFDMGTPDTSAGSGEPNSLLSNLVNQGNMLNQAEAYWETGELFGLMNTEIMQDYGDYNFDIVNTEIARRASLLVQGIGKAISGSSHLAAMPSWKQGNMRQGGPADTMLRRIVLPEGYDGSQGIEVNPYAFENMVCETFLIAPGTNPYYPGGVCDDPAINLSGVMPDTCLDDESKETSNCPTVDFDTVSTTYGIGDTNPILQGYIKSGGEGGGDPEESSGNKTRVLTWHQCPSVHTVLGSDFDPVTCGTADWAGNINADNFDDQSWYNPLDVSKGHRGFIDGDFVMFLYGWSPNWRLNAKGNDRYELYVRRSFDGGLTWGTTPSSFQASNGVSYPGDGTVTCESYRKTETGEGDPVEPKICYAFDAGAAEHARNVTQHKSMNITTLDPRYASAGSPRGVGIDELTCTDGLFVDNSVIDTIFTCDDTSLLQDTDLRNPSRYFMVFETGDNKTVQEGEAEPLNLYYSRAESFGDDYVVWTETDTGYDGFDGTAVCYPTINYGEVLNTDDVRIGSGFCNEFDRMNTGGDSHSSEASLAGNSDASKMYGVTAQWEFEDDDDYESEILDADAMARRVWWIDLYRSDNPDLIYTLPGTQTDSP